MSQRHFGALVQLAYVAAHVSALAAFAEKRAPTAQQFLSFVSRKRKSKPNFCASLALTRSNVLGI